MTLYFSSANHVFPPQKLKQGYKKTIGLLFHYSHKMVNEPLTAGRVDQSDVADRYSIQSARAPQIRGVVSCQSPVDRRGDSANDDGDAEPDRSPVPNFTVSNKSFGNHRNSMREGREEGAKN